MGNLEGKQLKCFEIFWKIVVKIASKEAKEFICRGRYCIFDFLVSNVFDVNVELD